MLNAIASTVADPVGYVELRVRDDSTDGATRRRVSRVATLDGGVVINDSGYSPGDRTLELNWSSQEADAAVDRLIRLYNRLTVATRSAVYLVAPESYTPGAEESRLILLVIDQLS